MNQLRSESIAPTRDVNIGAVESIPSPRDIVAELPESPAANAVVVEGRRTIERILLQQDHRMLVVVGPCSIHDQDAALDYAARLAKLRDQVNDRVFVLMRVYFEKPRTTVGWKGLINDPHLNGSFDIAEGLRIARRLVLCITELGVPIGTELLDPITPQYIADLVSWAAIGARTTESQTHRQMASGLSMPVGYKNGTEGNLQVALDAMRAAQTPHAFLGIDEQGKVAIVKTLGNRFGHPILRGGRQRSNFAPADVAAAARQLAAAGLPTNLMVDCSHANANKKAEKQQVAVRSVVEQRQQGNRDLFGLMLESNIHEGNQPLSDDLSALRYGVSITDPCIGWEETEDLILWAYDHLG